MNDAGARGFVARLVARGAGLVDDVRPPAPAPPSLGDEPDIEQAEAVESPSPAVAIDPAPATAPESHAATAPVATPPPPTLVTGPAVAPATVAPVLRRQPEPAAPGAETAVAPDGQPPPAGQDPGAPPIVIPRPTDVERGHAIPARATTDEPLSRPARASEVSAISVITPAASPPTVLAEPPALVTRVLRAADPPVPAPVTAASAPRPVRPRVPAPRPPVGSATKPAPTPAPVATRPRLEIGTIEVRLDPPPAPSEPFAPPAPAATSGFDDYLATRSYSR